MVYLYFQGQETTFISLSDVRKSQKKKKRHDVIGHWCVFSPGPSELWHHPVSLMEVGALQTGDSYICTCDWMLLRAMKSKWNVCSWFLWKKSCFIIYRRVSGLTNVLLITQAFIPRKWTSQLLQCYLLHWWMPIGDFLSFFSFFLFFFRFAFFFSIYCSCVSFSFALIIT